MDEEVLELPEIIVLSIERARMEAPKNPFLGHTLGAKTARPPFVMDSDLIGSALWRPSRFSRKLIDINPPRRGNSLPV